MPNDCYVKTLSETCLSALGPILLLSTAGQVFGSVGVPTKSESGNGIVRKRRAV
jgi:hypothetical protein